MEGIAVLATVLAVSAVMLPLALVWYLNIGGLMAARKYMRTAGRARAAGKTE